MPVSVVNNVATADAYTDGLTVWFVRPRPGFSINVFNAAIFYTLFYTPLNRPATTPTALPDEHMLAPSLSTFSDALAEGLPPDTGFGGVMIRSAVAGTPARVTVA